MKNIFLLILVGGILQSCGGNLPGYSKEEKAVILDSNTIFGNDSEGEAALPSDGDKNKNEDSIFDNKTACIHIDPKEPKVLTKVVVDPPKRNLAEPPLVDITIPGAPVTPPGNPENPYDSPDGNITFTVRRVCSDRNTIFTETNFVTTTDLTIEVVDRKNEILCLIDNTEFIKKTVIEKGVIDLSSCPPFNDEDIGDVIIMAKVNDKFKRISKRSRRIRSYSRRKDDQKNYSYNNVISLLFDYNDRSSIDRTPALYPDLCDSNQSPLAVTLPQHFPTQLNLGPSVDGVMFDILGYHATPIPFKKYQIGWPTSKDVMFIVKPNLKGAVAGIQEMFGNNTIGPDTKDSYSGYEALAKYDGTNSSGSIQLSKKDKKINSEDLIFSHLRLWSDKNRDGISTKDELFTLPEMGVVELDLDYDAGFCETDQYGNEVKFKSLVVMETSGSYGVLFDIWFFLGNQK